MLQEITCTSISYEYLKHKTCSFHSARQSFKLEQQRRKIPSYFLFSFARSSEVNMLCVCCVFAPLKKQPCPSTWPHRLPIFRGMNTQPNPSVHIQHVNQQPRAASAPPAPVRSAAPLRRAAPPRSSAPRCANVAPQPPQFPVGDSTVSWLSDQDQDQAGGGIKQAHLLLIGGVF